MGFGHLLWQLVIAQHTRSYGREEMIFNPLHYLALLEQKSQALDQAAPLQALKLPEEFHELRRQMEARPGKRGRPEDSGRKFQAARALWPKNPFTPL